MFASMNIIGRRVLPATFMKFYSSEAPTPQRMERGVNNVTLVGRVGNDPQLRGAEDRQVAIFSLATNSAYKSAESGEFQQKTEWHRIGVFKPNLRDLVYTYVKKGNRLMVQGKITYGQITDSNGTQHSVTTISADDILFLGRPASKEGDQSYSYSESHE